MTYKKIVILILSGFILLIFSPGKIFAENIAGNDAWRKLEQGFLAYDKGELGEALLFCEQAKVIHTAEISAFTANLKKSLSSSEVKKAGDDIMGIYAVLEKRNESVAAGIINSVLLNHKVEDFGKSMKELLSWLEKRLVYPEADFLTGKIYEAEGENSLALAYYEKAWENRDFLDIPDERFTLAYRMADLSLNMKNVWAQEQYLFLVLLDDEVFGKPGMESPTLQAMLHIIKDDITTEKFFKLYRHAYYTGLKAYQDLAALYYSSNNLDRALPVAVLASTISVTRLDEALKQVDFEYVYANFSDLLIRTGKNNAISGWAKEIKLWDSFLLLARILYDSGERQQAVSIWTALAGYCPDKVTARKSMALLGQLTR